MKFDRRLLWIVLVSIALFVWFIPNPANRKTEYEATVLMQANWGSGEGEFGGRVSVIEPTIIKGPEGIIVDDYGNIWVGDWINRRIMGVNPEGDIFSIIEIEEATGGTLNLDMDGNLVWVDELNQNLVFYSTDGVFLRRIKLQPEQEPLLWGASDIASSGRKIYLLLSAVDKSEMWHEVLEVDVASGDTTCMVGISTNAIGEVRSLGEYEWHYRPTGLGIDKQGRLWVAGVQEDQASVLMVSGEVEKEYPLYIKANKVNLLGADRWDQIYIAVPTAEETVMMRLGHNTTDVTMINGIQSGADTLSVDEEGTIYGLFPSSSGCNLIKFQ